MAESGKKVYLTRYTPVPNELVGVPLHAENGTVIGSAMVTFKDGTWNAVVQMTDDALKELGVDLTFMYGGGMFLADQDRLVAKIHD